jgi:ABC-type sugar transport system substrate-binding protein
MKKSIIFSVIAIVAMLIAACAPKVVTETKTVVETQIVEVEKKGNVTIGYGAPELSGGQGQIMNGLVTHSEAKKWAVVTTNANFSAETQANQMDYFMSLGVDAIVTVPVDSKAICSSVKKAKDAGIPFYTIDRAPIGCEVNMVIQSDNYLAGKQAGEAMVELLTKKYGEAKGTVLELQGDLGQNVAQLRGGGFNDVMKAYPNITVISKPTEWSADKFSSSTLDVVGSTAVDGIYMHSDCVGTTVVLAALEQLGKKFKAGEPGHIFLTGVDGCKEALQAIRDGYSDEASSQPIPDFGIIVNWIQDKFDGKDPVEGEIVQAGALWSPANIVKSDVGFMANLSTTKVTSANAADKALWGNN